MTFEVELKARLASPDLVEAQAAKLGRLKKETRKEDIYFRRKGDTRAAPKDRFRLRREAGRSVVTSKEKIVADGSEVNRETEFTVDDDFAFFRFIDRFGFEPFVVKRKTSRVYQIGRASVELNEVEHLGYFIEIEILVDDESEVTVARTELARLFNRLGFTAEALEPRYYILMIQEAYPARYRFVDDPTLEWPFEEVLE